MIATLTQREKQLARYDCADLRPSTAQGMVTWLCGGGWSAKGSR
jgi:hypothetical protein